ELAYGKKGAGKVIPPDAELTFEVELLKTVELTETDVKEGKGAAAMRGDFVGGHYTGWLKEGKKFDSSRERNKTFKFELGEHEVIMGWDEGGVGMKVGGTRKLVIPSELAYGKKGRGKTIPPNAELTFEVELLEITK